MHGGVLLSRLRIGIESALLQFAPAGEEGLRVPLPLALLRNGLAVPPAVRCIERLASPALDDLVLVAVVEAVEHHIHPRFTARLSHLDGVPDRIDAPVDGRTVPC